MFAIASSGIVLIRLSKKSPDLLMNSEIKRFENELSKYYPDIVGHLENWMLWYPKHEELYLDRIQNREDFEFVLADAAGQWLMWQLLGRFPDDGDDDATFRTVINIGYLITNATKSLSDNENKSEN